MSSTLPVVPKEAVGLEDLSATICAELAAGLADAEGIKEKYDITDGRWRTLKRSRAFRNMLKEAIQEWTGDLNAGRRITKKAEIMLEDSMPVLHAIAHGADVPSQQKIDSVKQMAALAGRNVRDAGSLTGRDEKTTINIHIDSGKKEEAQTITIDATRIEDLSPASSG